MSGGDQLPNPLQHRLQLSSFSKTPPGGDDPERLGPVAPRLFGRLEHPIRIEQRVGRDSGIMVGRLRAELAILRAVSRLGVDDGAEVDLIAPIVVPNAVR